VQPQDIVGCGNFAHELGYFWASFGGLLGRNFWADVAKLVWS